ncbi:MAG: hypothetical protein M3M94_01890, partial [Actinomycetota bacterium]|nr:hypothetical protein [Actinomycetota bacterium]
MSGGGSARIEIPRWTQVVGLALLLAPVSLLADAARHVVVAVLPLGAVVAVRRRSRRIAPRPTLRSRTDGAWSWTVGAAAISARSRRSSGAV